MSTLARAQVPRLLLVEDDTISQSFFRQALKNLPAEVDACDCVAAAVTLTAGHHHDLWLVDVNLPDGDGIGLLRQLRAAYPGIPALAHTADASAELRTQLLDAGFCEVLVKPFSGDFLLKAVRRTLARGGDTASFASDELTHDWDETAALAALNGQRQHLLALRELFMAELPITRDAVSEALAHEDTAALKGQLHRLQASCGFVGAARLGRAVRQLHQDPASTQARSQFRDAISALLH